jgi:hypothetical protein
VLVPTGSSMAGRVLRELPHQLMTTFAPGALGGLQVETVAAQQLVFGDVVFVANALLAADSRQGHLWERLGACPSGLCLTHHAAVPCLLQRPRPM